MKIQVKSGGHNIRLCLPTGLIFHPIIARFAVRFGLRHARDEAQNITPEAIEALFAEFRRIKKKYGPWELVDIESADGSEMVNIRL